MLLLDKNLKIKKTLSALTATSTERPFKMKCLEGTRLGFVWNLFCFVFEIGSHVVEVSLKLGGKG